jgi:hypothetical protein
VRKAHRAADLVSALRNPALLHASPRETSSVCLPIPDRLLELTLLFHLCNLTSHL